jgi:5-methylcytosine-specific restriction endonuclease McrA
MEFKKRSTFPANKGARVSKSKRRKIYDRDKYICQICGELLGPDGDLTLDHIIPRRFGGDKSYENLRVACRPCNSSKGIKHELP